MAIQHHEDAELVAGDDWVIRGRLLDSLGRPFSLVDASVYWTLNDPSGNVMDIAFTLDVVEPRTSGVITITVPSAVTKTLRAGRYIDALRVLVGGVRETFWIGAILVNANPFLEESS